MTESAWHLVPRSPSTPSRLRALRSQRAGGCSASSATRCTTPRRAQTALPAPTRSLTWRCACICGSFTSKRRWAAGTRAASVARVTAVTLTWCGRWRSCCCAQRAGVASQMSLQRAASMTAARTTEDGSRASPSLRCGSCVCCGRQCPLGLCRPAYARLQRQCCRGCSASPRRRSCRRSRFRRHCSLRCRRSSSSRRAILGGGCCSMSPSHRRCAPSTPPPLTRPAPQSSDASSDRQPLSSSKTARSASTAPSPRRWRLNASPRFANSIRASARAWPWRARVLDASARRRRSRASRPRAAPRRSHSTRGRSGWRCAS
mmetsp:Transcript_8017/g.18787  ORF Transcript_8017/g.18787 Transcript_8017/m.18787 type:complete len:317 (-) Transcript_8017:3171-4121(-)